MKLRKIVIPTIFVFIPMLLFVGCIIGRNAQKKRNFEQLSEEFLPIFEDVNQELGGVFSYKDAHYSSGNLMEYSLTFTGDDSKFIESSIAFCNEFSTAVMDKKYDAHRLKGEYILRIKASEIYLNCWYGMESSSLTASTNATDNCAIFETLKGTRKLTVVTKNFTEEQREYAKSFQDKCSFELVLSDKIPW